MPTITRRYKNVCEAAFADLARANGWRVTKRGWPDFLCIGPGDEVIAVEVKPRYKRDPQRLESLRVDQTLCMVFLQSHGVRCFVSDGASLEKFDLARHGHQAAYYARRLDRRRRRRVPSKH